MLRRWVFLAIFFRLISAYATSSWFHPDEWYQSVELGNLIARGFAFYSQEVSLHLRNLLWPLLLTLPIGIADKLAPDAIHFRVVLFQFFTGLLDLGILWGVWRLVVEALPPDLSSRVRGRWENGVLALFVLPWFWMWDAIRPSSEHLSAIAIWVALGLLAKPKARPALAGFFAVAIAAFRYPSGLFSAGMALALAVSAFRSDEDRRRFVRFTGGAVIGLCLLGLPDAWIYGRPWESLGMYLQYNVFTGLSAHVFGAQPASTYLEFFAWRGLRYGINAPVTLIAASLSLYGLTIGAGRRAPWAWGLLVYAMGHLAVSHKEQRFVFPVWAVILWSAVYGAIALAQSPHLKAYWRHIFARRHVFKAAAGVSTLYVGVNLLFTLKALWGETLITPSTYFDLPDYLKRYPNTCAMMSPRMLNSVLLPWSDPASPQAAKIAIGWETAGNRQTPLFSGNGMVGLAWLDHPAACSPGDDVLMQLNSPEDAATSNGCELLGSGILSKVPHSAWEWALENHYAKGVWYRCPSGILSHLIDPGLRHVTVTGFQRWPRLPPFGISGERFLELAREASPPPPGVELNH